MIVDRLNTAEWCDVTTDDIERVDPYYAHVCPDTTGADRVPIPIAILREDAVGVEARAWMRLWIERQRCDDMLRHMAGGFFRWQSAASRTE